MNAKRFAILMDSVTNELRRQEEGAKVLWDDGRFHLLIDGQALICIDDICDAILSKWEELA